MTLPNPTEFRLSRIYAEGWNAAHKLSANECSALDGNRIARLNPYAIEPQKSRWSEGFTKALAI